MHTSVSLVGRRMNRETFKISNPKDLFSPFSRRLARRARCYTPCTCLLCDRMPFFPRKGRRKEWKPAPAASDANWGRVRETPRGREGGGGISGSGCTAPPRRRRDPHTREVQQTLTHHPACRFPCPSLQHARELLSYAFPCRLPHARRACHCGWLRGENNDSCTSCIGRRSNLGCAQTPAGGGWRNNAVAGLHGIDGPCEVVSGGLGLYSIRYGERRGDLLNWL